MSGAPRLGILGGGQLGRMLALAAAPLGVRCRVLDPAERPPAHVAAEVVRAAYDDVGAVERLAAGLDVVTYEFENVPAATVKALQHAGVTVHPGARSLATTQDRLTEKRFLRACGVPTVAFAPVHDEAGIAAALEAVGLPALLKTRRLGYDGRGQRPVDTAGDVLAAWTELGRVPCILEARADLRRELATLAVRGIDGEVRSYAAVETRQADGLLRSAVAPAAGLDAGATEHLLALHRRLVDDLDHVGVLAVEWFDTPGGLLANEMAPRVHNSGHWTIEASVTSQFANHVRAVCGMPLGPAEMVGFAGLVNIVGTLPDVDALVGVCGASVHLYDKEPRPLRKLGHVTVVASTEAERDERLARVAAIVAGEAPAER